MTQSRLEMFSENLMRETLKQSATRPRIYHFDFYSIGVERISPGVFELSQEYYIQNLHYTSCEATFEAYQWHQL